MRLLRLRWRTIVWIGIITGIVFVIGWTALRPGMSDVTSMEAAQNLLTNGKPTFVEFFSNY